MTNEAKINTHSRERVRHNDSDSEIVDRSRLARWMVLILSAILLAVVPGYIFSYVLSFFKIESLTWLGWIAGIAAGGYVFSNWYPKRFLVTVGQVRAFVTLNPLLSFFNISGNPNVTYGPGDNISFPWERRSEKGNVPLDIITIDWTEEVPGRGVQLLAKGSYQYKPDITKASRFIGIDDSTIRGGAIDLIKSRVSSMLGTKSADTAKKNIPAYNEELGAYFGIETNRPSLEVSNFEDSYGIHSVQVTISGIDLPTHAQKTRDALDEAEQVLKGVAKMYGMSVAGLRQKIESGAISKEQYNDMLDKFAGFSENAKLDVKVYKVSQLQEAVATFARVFGEVMNRNAPQKGTNNE